jgi:hypothetical protein
LCHLIGRDVENGEMPNDDPLLGHMIRNICYANAKQYLQLPAAEAGAEGRKQSAARVPKAPRRKN